MIDLELGSLNQSPVLRAHWSSRLCLDVVQEEINEKLDPFCMSAFRQFLREVRGWVIRYKQSSETTEILSVEI